MKNNILIGIILLLIIGFLSYCLRQSNKTIKEQERTSIEDVLEPADFKRMLRMSKKKGMIQCVKV